MGYDDFGLPADDGPDEQDLAARLETAERELAALRKKHGAATPANGAKPPAAPGEVDLDGLLAKVSDRSRPWPEIEAELAATHGFTSSVPAPSTRGFRSGQR
jgi:hypothetical protein